jgi:GT2 family glycosyltransferase
MDLSIIIVNYNVRYFLEQLLFSIRNAQKALNIEVFVVDNQSTDQSCEMVQTLFPEVHLIANNSNPGFSIANNQALAEAKGRYVLFLNPDTLIAEDTLTKCVSYMDSNEQAGALGVRMVDGSGHFLPESKRGLPLPSTSFYKLSGLYKIFPDSPRINKYYMGHLPEDKTAAVEVLTGAFFFARKSVLDKIGGFDENFFMYGEDIDLSYRVQLAGYQVIYFPETTIIHYKGESTRKDSVKYIRHFYEAMLIFADKHFKNGYPFWLRGLLMAGVFVKGSYAAFQTFLKKISWPVLDLISIALILTCIKYVWAIYYHHDPDYYSGIFERVNLPVFLLVWMLSFYYSGVYDKPKAIDRLIVAVINGLLVNGLIYGMLNAAYRPSRPILIFGFLAILTILPLLRILWYKIKQGIWIFGKKTSKRVLIAGTESEYTRLGQLIQHAEPEARVIGFVQPDAETEQKHSALLGRVRDMDEVLRAHRVDEVVMSARDFSAADIMYHLNRHGAKYPFKMASPGSDSIIGSKSKSEVGELYTFHINYKLAQAEWKRRKRTLDVLFSSLILLFLPLIIWFYHSKGKFLNNLWEVLSGKKTWVGYAKAGVNSELPLLPEGVLTISNTRVEEAAVNRNIEYARYYSLSEDINLIFRQISDWSQ